LEIDGRKFLVTGGSGFIGSHVVDRLVAAGAAEVVVFDRQLRRENLAEADASGRVRVVERDVSDALALERELAGVDGVFHMAVLPLKPCDDDPRTCLEVNVLGSFNVFDACRRADVKKVVFSSASSVYGDTNATMDETHPLGARTMYGASKVAAEYVLRAFTDLHELDYLILRYMNVYGPRQDGGLVINVMRRIKSGEPPTIMGDGSQSFDFVHVADVAGANLAAMASDVTDAAFNIGGGNEVTVKQIVEKLIALYGSDLEPQIDVGARVPMSRRVGSSEKAMRELNWHPEYDLDRGLADVIAHFDS
jgi:nucleoside-diphosphate-sugar epimerase